MGAARLTLWGVALFLVWNFLLLLFLLGKSSPPAQLTAQVSGLVRDVEVQLEEQKSLLQEIQRLRRAPLGPGLAQHEARTNDSVIPILVIACDRPTVSRCLDRLLRFRPSASQFPIVVSQDCGHAETARIIQSYGKQVTHLRQPDLSDVPSPPGHRRFQGYYRIARHYAWALGQLFDVLGHAAAVVVEDDLDVASDFFSYFSAALPLLRSDPSLWCASAWNDNGKPGLVDARRPQLLHRTDFFPGLGWLLLAELWRELAPPRWPAAFWDDWMRDGERRRGRQCVRPEVPRAVTFGRGGVSQGQFYERHLRHMRLNAEAAAVDFAAPGGAGAEALRALAPAEDYARRFLRRVYNGSDEETLARVLEAGRLSGAGGAEGGGGRPRPARVTYRSADEFKAAARSLGLMDDLKAGVPRGAYRGVVSVMHAGRRVHLAPPPGWTGYDPSWT
ncbi:alpha-1,3-mannosyl-glycoprotein 2-beta-N-acetylglucosaminyltransferase-like [Petromyzon marinus]|uniref:alpha-1,3-mannosyl-glycoprotein 2-beta-N-acetylglucosaminyltransferase-like n=1 Tax=Petromyzon marinus TaxID=7757 RepID=UPI003F7195B4